MPSDARREFTQNAIDVDRLLALHTATGGSAPGRRQGLEVLNKAGIVLVCAVWEAYCEDVCLEALYLLLRSARRTHSPALPKELKKAVAAAIEADKNELAAWDLAGRGWFSAAYIAIDDLVTRFNTPKAANVDGLFKASLGIKALSNHWHWPHMNALPARRKLDRYVTLRGDIAHRSKAQRAVHKQQVKSFLSHSKQLVACCDRAISAHLNHLGVTVAW